MAHQSQCKEEIKRLWDKYNTTRSQHDDGQPTKKRRTSENDTHDTSQVTNMEEDDDYPKGIIARVTNIHPASSKTTVKVVWYSNYVLHNKRYSWYHLDITGKLWCQDCLSQLQKEHIYGKLVPVVDSMTLTCSYSVIFD